MAETRIVTFSDRKLGDDPPIINQGRMYKIVIYPEKGTIEVQYQYGKDDAGAFDSINQYRSNSFTFADITGLTTGLRQMLTAINNHIQTNGLI